MDNPSNNTHPPVESSMTAADHEGRAISPHWKKTAGDGKQHWDWMWDFFGPVWFICNVTKYVMRYRNKDGLKDLYKCRNYLNKLIEKVESDSRRAHIPGLTNLKADDLAHQLLESIIQEEYNSK